MRQLSFVRSKVFHGQQVVLAVALLSAACAAESDDAANGDDVPGVEVVHGRPAEAAAVDLGQASPNTGLEDDMPALQGSGVNLIEEVVLPGRKVGFYELDDGTLVTAQVGSLGNTSTAVEERGLRGARLYEFLTRKPAPKRLVDAELRSGGATQDVSPEPNIAAVDKALPRCGAPQGGCAIAPYTREDWIADRCTGSRGYELRIEDLWMTGSSTISGISAPRFRADLLVNKGRVRFEAKFNGTRGGYAYVYMLVSAGQYVEFSGAQPQELVRKSAWSKVYEADGDIYDHCVRWG